MLRENAEISASPWRWGWQTCAERRKWMRSTLWRCSGLSFWQVRFEVLWRHPNERCPKSFWGNACQPQKGVTAITWVQMQWYWIDSFRKVAYLSLSPISPHVTLSSLSPHYSGGDTIHGLPYAREVLHHWVLPTAHPGRLHGPRPQMKSAQISVRVYAGTEDENQPDELQCVWKSSQE